MKKTRKFQIDGWHLALEILPTKGKRLIYLIDEPFYIAMIQIDLSEASW